MRSLSVRKKKGNSVRLSSIIASSQVLEAKTWKKKHTNTLLNYKIEKKKQLTLILPERLDLSSNYELTITYISAIRRLAQRKPKQVRKKEIQLASVNFDGLISISTSAALVLTAELCKWQDALGKKLIPQTHHWNTGVYSQLKALGFFTLFKEPKHKPEETTNSDLNFVNYLKGKATETAITRELNRSLTSVIGEKINKWTFLRSGLDEAITNVSHHAYPRSLKVNEEDKNWYLTGSYNSRTKKLKIAFYDQGIGIPRSLPTSTIKERIQKYLSNFAKSEKRLHKTLLKAAVQLDRTSTQESDRGKGLYDLLTFINERGDGYLSIISLKGLYKYSLSKGQKEEKSVSFNNELPGTLIIWAVTLDN